MYIPESDVDWIRRTAKQKRNKSVKRTGYLVTNFKHVFANELSEHITESVNKHVPEHQFAYDVNRSKAVLFISRGVCVTNVFIVFVPYVYKFRISQTVGQLF